MKIKLMETNLFAIVTALLLLLLGPANAYGSNGNRGCVPITPGDIEIKLKAAIDNALAGGALPPPLCKGWDTEIDPTFSQWQTHGSQNLAVVTAAAGLWFFPKEAVMPKSPPGNPITWVKWWTVYLSAQTCEGAACNQTGVPPDHQPFLL
jgi:hypothetical protein